jgi:hypothetical protein
MGRPIGKSETGCKSNFPPTPSTHHSAPVTIRLPESTAAHVAASSPLPPRAPPISPLPACRHASGRRRRLPLPRRRGVQSRAPAPAAEAPRCPRRRLPSRLQGQARPAALQGAIACLY